MDCTGIGIGIRSFCEGDASVRVISSCNRRRSTTLSDQLDWHFSSTTIFLLFLSRLSVNKVPSFFKSFLLQRISKGSRDKDCCLFHKMKTITRESIMLLKTLSPYVISVQVRRKVRRKFTRDSSRSFDFVRGKEKVNNSRFDAISVKGISPLAPILRTQPTHIVTRDVVALCDTQEAKSTGRILPRAISEMSLRGSRGVANIRRFGARFGNLSPSLPHFPSILDNSPAHVSRTIRNPLRDWLRAAIFPTFSIDIASANEPEFFPNQLNFSPFFRTCWTCPRDSINAFAEAKAKKSKWIIRYHQIA